MHLVRSKASTLFQEIFNEVCFTCGSYIFFVSEKYAKNEHLQELWDKRLVHLLFKGHFAFEGDKCKKYDIYKIDYGHYVTMRNNKRGDKILLAVKGFIPSSRLVYNDNL